MLTRLQRRTLIPSQIAGYAATLLVGATIVMLACQLYGDLRPLLTQQTDVFRGHAVTLSKNISAFQSLNKRGIYFTDKEMEELKAQPFVSDVAPFRSCTFQTHATLDFGGQGLATDLFFESVPDRYIDVESAAWHFDTALTSPQEIPIIIPEDYLSLYNFGFAESQALPVVSKGTVERVTFSVTLAGNGLRETFRARIVGFSGKINTILVPEEFLQWANHRYGTPTNALTHSHTNALPSRLLVELSDASDERLPRFMEEHGYNLKQDELESSKMLFFFRAAMAFLLTVAALIIALSVAFLILSLNLILQRNRDLYVNLHLIGYPVKAIARYYRRLVCLITLAALAVATAVTLTVRSLYVAKLGTVFAVEGSVWPTVVAAAALTLLLMVGYNATILHSVRMVALSR
jgi:hypothetical protein